MNAPKEILYAAVGVGDFAIEKARKAQYAVDVRKLRDAYGDLVERGQKTVIGIRRSAPTKRAVEQTKTARSQTKAAVTSVKKAATSTVEATRNAATSI